MSMCPACDSTNTTVINEYDYEGHIIENAGVIKCNDCEEETIPLNTAKRMEELNYTILHILSPKQIIARRKIICKSQDEVARAIGVNRSTLHRWEKGQVYQNKSHDKALREYFHAEERIIPQQKWLDSFIDNIDDYVNDNSLSPGVAAHGNRAISSSESDEIRDKIKSLSSG